MRGRSGDAAREAMVSVLDNAGLDAQLSVAVLINTLITLEEDLKSRISYRNLFAKVGIAKAWARATQRCDEVKGLGIDTCQSLVEQARIYDAEAHADAALSDAGWDTLAAAKMASADALQALGQNKKEKQKR